MLCVGVCVYHTYCVDDHTPCPALHSLAAQVYKLQIAVNFAVFGPYSKINKYIICIVTCFRVIRFTRMACVTSERHYTAAVVDKFRSV